MLVELDVAPVAIQNGAVVDKKAKLELDGVMVNDFEDLDGTVADTCKL
jgi:hypothetical protein